LDSFWVEKQATKWELVLYLFLGQPATNGGSMTRETAFLNDTII
jgi:hypothetical protein